MNLDHLKTQLPAEPTRVAVVWPSDESTRGALAMALAEGQFDITIFGATDEVKADERLQHYLQQVALVETDDPDEAARMAVAMARQDRADVIMKGMINTDNLLRCVLNREEGIVEHGSVLTHISCAHIPAYPRLLLFTDPAVMPAPNEKQRLQQVRYVIDVARSFGVEAPKVALLHCTEKVDAKHFPFTAQYPELRRIAEAGEFGPCVVDGPTDIKVACDAVALKKKHLTSPLQGESDALIFPEIEGANVFYKTITLWANAQTAGIAVGAKVPLVIASRGDNALCKYHSMLLGACVAKNNAKLQSHV